MDLFNPIINNTENQLGHAKLRQFDYDRSRIWEETASFELVMSRDSAFELGGSSFPCVNFTCVTSSPKLVEKDEILVCGPDLNELKADTPYARIVLLRVGDIESDDDDTEHAFRAIQDMDFVKYHVFPKGFMIRTSSENHREQVRISKEALQKGISFERIGNTFISHYRQNSNILAVKMIFVTAPDADYAALQKTAAQVRDITMSLSKILEGMPTDCGSCQLKPICDEVEGMRELHFGKDSMAASKEKAQ